MRRVTWPWIERHGVRILVGGAGATVLAVILLLAGDGVARRRTANDDGSFRQTVYTYGGWEQQEGDLQGVRTSESRSYAGAVEYLRCRIREIPAGSPQSSRDRAQRTLENVAAVQSAGRTAQVVLVGCLAAAVACLLTWTLLSRIRSLVAIAAGTIGLAALLWYVAQIREHTEVGLFIVVPKAPLRMTAPATLASGLLGLGIALSAATLASSSRCRGRPVDTTSPAPNPQSGRSHTQARWTPAVFVAVCALLLGTVLLLRPGDPNSDDEVLRVLTEGDVVDLGLLAVATLLLFTAVVPIRAVARRRSEWLLASSGSALVFAWRSPAVAEGAIFLLSIGLAMATYGLVRRRGADARTGSKWAPAAGVTMLGLALLIGFPYMEGYDGLGLGLLPPGEDNPATIRPPWFVGPGILLLAAVRSRSVVRTFVWTGIAGIAGLTLGLLAWLDLSGRISGDRGSRWHDVTTVGYMALVLLLAGTVLSAVGLLGARSTAPSVPVHDSEARD